jgi:predicted metal-binding protein
MSPQHTIFVCTTCASAHRTKKAIRVSGGERLLEQLKTLHNGWSLYDDFSIQPVNCMGVCDRDCAIALMAPGKSTYLIGNLSIDDGNLESTATAVLDCASLYHAKPDGTFSYIRCPELLKKNVLAKLPPMPENLQPIHDPAN